MSAIADGRRGWLLRWVVVTGACLGIGGCASGGPRQASRSAVPTPRVTGPVASTPSNFPFIADGFGPEPPVPSGYEENEYFISGRAKLYEYSATGVRVIAPCPASAGRSSSSTMTMSSWKGSRPSAWTMWTISRRCC